MCPSRISVFPTIKAPPGDSVMTVQCCVCRKYRVKDTWKTNTKVEKPLSHTYCPKCKEEALRTTLKRNNTPVLAK